MMDERQRMLDQDLSGLERVLLEEGRSYSPPERLRANTLSALGVATSAGLGGGLWAWLSTKAWTTKIILGISAMAFLGAAPATYLLLIKGGGTTNTPPPAALPAAPAIPAVAEPETVAGDVEPPPAMPPPAPARASAPVTSPLRAELAALDGVRATLASEPEKALSLLAAYFRTFPHGRLHPEAEVLRIDAFAKAGQMTAAKKHAQEFVRRYPNSLLTARVRPYAEQ